MLPQAQKWLQVKPRWVRSFKYISHTQALSVRTFPMTRNRKPSETGLLTKGSNRLIKSTVQDCLWLQAWLDPRGHLVSSKFLFLNILPLPPRISFMFRQVLVTGCKDGPDIPVVLKKKRESLLCACLVPISIPENVSSLAWVIGPSLD